MAGTRNGSPPMNSEWKEKASRARGVAGRELGDLRAHALAVAREVEVLALLGPADPVARIELAQHDLAVQVQAAGGERLLQYPGHRDQRWPCVPGEAAAAEPVGA